MYFRLGSIISLNVSPIVLNENAIRKIAKPGTIAAQGAYTRYALDCCIRTPQSGVGGLGPSPKKLRPATLNRVPGILKVI